MQSITIYSTPICGYCSAAKRLLQTKGVSFEDIDVMKSPERREEMIARANGRQTVPQIFIGDAHIGGYDDMAALERAGKLDALLTN